MTNARRAFGIFLAIQACAMLIVTFVLSNASVFRAVVPAQAALVGILLAVGPVQHAARIVGAIVVGALFAVVVTTLALRLDIGGLFGMHGYGWQFLMITVRALLIGAFCWRSLRCEGYILSSSGEPAIDSLLRFRVHHFLALTSLVALFIVIIQNLSGGSFYGVSLVAYVILLGVAYALMDLLASLLSLEQTYTLPKTIVYVMALLTFSFAIAAHAYASASGWSSARFTWLEAMVEVSWICGSLLGLRLSGFRLAKVPDAPLASPDTKFTLK